MPPTGSLVFHWATSPKSLGKVKAAAASPADPSSSKNFAFSLPGMTSRTSIQFCLPNLHFLSYECYTRAFNLVTNSVAFSPV